MSDEDKPENQGSNSQSQKKNLKDFFNREPIQSKITDPDPNFIQEPESTGEKAEDIMFREAAKKLAGIEEEISSLVQEYQATFPNQPPLPDNISVIAGPTPRGHIIANVMTWPTGEKSKVSRLFHQVNAQSREFLRAYNVETDISLSVDGIYTDEPTAEQYQVILEQNPDLEKKVKTHYYFDKNGNFFKWCNIPEEIEVDEDRFIQKPYSNEKHIYSRMSARDFELAGQLLGGMKNALSTSLGKNPDESIGSH